MTEDKDVLPVDVVDPGGEVMVIEETEDDLDDGPKVGDCIDGERVGCTGVGRNAGDAGCDDGVSGAPRPPMTSIRPKPVTPSRIAPTTSLTASEPDDPGSGLERVSGEGEVS